MKINTDPKLIDEILDRGIIKEIIPTSAAFRDRLLSGDKLKLYIGADPTSTALHLSHGKNYMLLEEFRKLGHEVVVLFGDFTARIGDPTGESSIRNQLTPEQARANVEGWISQIKPLIDFNAEDNPPKIVFNNDWLSSLSFEDVVNLASNFTVQQMLERDMFEKRIKQQQPVYLHEFLYPLMQGYDSVALDVDVELCGTDQIFNALVGRTLLRKMSKKDKFVVAVNLMENPVTGELMSKSKGTGVFLNSSPYDMYGGIMSQPDEMIEVLLVNNTRLPLSEVRVIVNMANKRDAKMLTALEITKIFHGEELAQKAEERFVQQVQKRQTPEDAPIVTISNDSSELIGVVRVCIPSESNSAIRRLFSQGAISVNGNIEKDFDSNINIPKEGVVVRIGKKRLFRVLVS